eukprot:3541659-Pyramimonas_sp.AAC.1
MKSTTLRVHRVGSPKISCIGWWCLWASRNSSCQADTAIRPSSSHSTTGEFNYAKVRICNSVRGSGGASGLLDGPDLQ